jgi:hypothetical protein
MLSHSAGKAQWLQWFEVSRATLSLEDFINQEVTIVPQEEFVELTYLFDNLSSAKAIMPELDTISPNVLTGVNACGRQDGKVIISCCIKKGHDSITEKVREILSQDGTPLSLTTTELVDNALAGEYTFSCLGNATMMLPLM